MDSKNRTMTKQTKSRIRPINTENKLMVAKGVGDGETGKMDEGEQRYRLPVMAQVTGRKGTAMER